MDRPLSLAQAAELLGTSIRFPLSMAMLRSPGVAK